MEELLRPLKYTGIYKTTLDDTKNECGYAFSKDGSSVNGAYISFGHDYSRAQIKASEVGDKIYFRCYNPAIHTWTGWKEISSK